MLGSRTSVTRPTLPFCLGWLSVNSLRNLGQSEDRTTFIPLKGLIHGFPSIANSSWVILSSTFWEPGVDFFEPGDTPFSSTFWVWEPDVDFFEPGDVRPSAFGETGVDFFEPGASAFWEPVAVFFEPGTSAFWEPGVNFFEPGVVNLFDISSAPLLCRRKMTASVKAVAMLGQSTHTFLRAGRGSFSRPRRGCTLSGLLGWLVGWLVG